MTRTHSRQINFDKLKQRGPSAAIVTRLMMACNDLSDSNRALTDWKASSSQSSLSKGTGMYFVRIEIAHLYGAMKIISSIENDSALLDLVNSCVCVEVF